MIPSTASELVRQVEQTVSLPDVCIRINELINDPNSSAADIAEVIMQDTDLTARLLRLVNSAYYGLAGEVDTISRAVTIVGTTELRDLSMIATACDLFTGIPEELFNMSDFWHRSITTGILARQLARRSDLLHSERLFVMGVLHDIGRLVILQQLTGEARDILLIAKGRNDLLTLAEFEVLGFTHPEVGAELARAWQLPEGLQLAIRHHHDPLVAQSYRLEAVLLHIAQLLAGALEEGIDTTEVLAEVPEELWGLCGLSTVDCQEVEAEIGPQVAGLFAVLMGEQRRRSG